MFAEVREANAKLFLRYHDFVSTGASRECSVCLDNAPLAECVSEEFWRAVVETPVHSNRACLCCGSRVGGLRHPAHYVRDGVIEHVNVCADCVFYITYGNPGDAGWSMEEDEIEALEKEDEDDWDW